MTSLVAALMALCGLLALAWVREHARADRWQESATDAQRQQAGALDWARQMQRRARLTAMPYSTAWTVKTAGMGEGPYREVGCQVTPNAASTPQALVSPAGPVHTSPIPADIAEWLAATDGTGLVCQPARFCPRCLRPAMDCPGHPAVPDTVPADWCDPTPQWEPIP